MKSLYVDLQREDKDGAVEGKGIYNKINPIEECYGEEMGSTRNLPAKSVS